MRTQSSVCARVCVFCVQRERVSKRGRERFIDSVCGIKYWMTALLLLVTGKLNFLK